MCEIKVAGKNGLAGLAAKVVAIASTLPNVSGIRVGQPVGYRGHAKVKFPARDWPEGAILVFACDEHGRRKICLLIGGRNPKRWAVRRIVRRRLAGEGIWGERGKS